MVEQDEVRHRVSGSLQKATKDTSSEIKLPESSVWARPPLFSPAALATSRMTMCSEIGSDRWGWLHEA
jgi:hypothetical protein